LAQKAENRLIAPNHKTTSIANDHSRCKIVAADCKQVKHKIVTADCKHAKRETTLPLREYNPRTACLFSLVFKSKGEA
jgi:hypothetical protein